MATTYNNKIIGFQNNSKDLVAIVYDSSGNLYDLSGYDAYLYMQKYPPRESNPLDVSISATSLDASAGSILFNLSQSDTNLAKGDYVYEVIIDDGSTNRHTIIQDVYHLNDSIT